MKMILTKKELMGFVFCLLLAVSASSVCFGAPPEMKTKLGEMVKVKLEDRVVQETNAEGVEKIMTYEIDPAHSSVGFKVRHLIGVAKGQFVRFQGTIFLRSELARSEVRGTIEAASIFTKNEERDRQVRGAEFLDVEKFPEIQFESKRVEPDRVVGNLTLRGVTREVVLYYVYHGSANGLDGLERIGFSVTTTINRKQFGIDYNKRQSQGLEVLGEEVPIEIEIEAIRKKEEGADKSPRKFRKPNERANQ